jgi:hypothetical protein
MYVLIDMDTHQSGDGWFSKEARKDGADICTEEGRQNASKMSMIAEEMVTSLGRKGDKGSLEKDVDEWMEGRWSIIHGDSEHD